MTCIYNGRLQLLLEFTGDLRQNSGAHLLVYWIFRRTFEFFLSYNSLGSSLPLQLEISGRVSKERISENYWRAGPIVDTGVRNLR